MTTQEQANVFRALKDGEDALTELLKKPVSDAKRRQIKEQLKNFVSVKIGFIRGLTL